MYTLAAEEWTDVHVVVVHADFQIEIVRSSWTTIVARHGGTPMLELLEVTIDLQLRRRIEKVVYTIYRLLYV